MSDKGIPKVPLNNRERIFTMANTQFQSVISNLVNRLCSFLKRMAGNKSPSLRTVYVDGASEVSPEVTAAISAACNAAVSEAVATSKTPVVAVLTTPTPTLTTNTSLADVFTVTVTQNITMGCTNGVDGKGTTWILTQGSGGSKNVTFDTTFAFPSSAGPLAWSTEEGKTDILAARYSALKGKWLVVSMVPGY